MIPNKATGSVKPTKTFFWSPFRPLYHEDDFDQVLHLADGGLHGNDGLRPATSRPRRGRASDLRRGSPVLCPAFEAERSEAVHPEGDSGPLPGDQEEVLR